MTMTAIGDLARMLVLRHHHAGLKNDLARLGAQMSTGVVDDPIRHLAGDTKPLAGLDRDLARLHVFDQSMNEGLIKARSLQMRLDRIGKGNQDLVSTITRFVSTPFAMRQDEIGAQARASLENAVQQMNASDAGRHLFSGAASHRRPLPSYEVVVSAVRNVVEGVDGAVEILQAIEQWMISPDGFVSEIYQGGSDPLGPIVTAEGQNIHLSVRADAPVLRESVVFSALAVVLSEDMAALASDERASLYSTISARVGQAQAGVIGLQADVGLSQSRLEEARTRQEAERFALHEMRNSLVGVDQFSSATEFQAVQQNLESLYAVTARAAQLSFVGFLR